MNLDFNKKNILIFGGANGVGLELASKLNKEGAKIIIVSKTSKNLKKLKKILLNDTYRTVISDCYKFSNFKIHAVRNND